MRSDPTPRARRRLPYRPCPPRPRTRARDTPIKRSVFLPAKMRSALATRLLAAFQNLRSRHLCFHCANLCQTVRRWLGIKSFDIQPGQEIGASKTVSNFVLGIAVRYMCREGGGGGRCRLIAAGSRHQSIPEVWKYRIELEEVKYPREAMGYNRACLSKLSVQGFRVR